MSQGGFRSQTHIALVYHYGAASRNAALNAVQLSDFHSTERRVKNMDKQK